MTDAKEKFEELFPNSQVWPLGHGAVMYSSGHGTHRGLFFMAGVPDDMIQNEWKQETPIFHNAGELMLHLMQIPNNQSCIIRFNTTDDVDRLIDKLLELKEDMISDAVT